LIQKVWLPGAASCVLFFGFYWILVLLPFDKTAYGLFFEGVPYTLRHFLAGLSVTLVFIVGLGSLMLVLGAWPFCRRTFTS
jgi:hypothetical protein